MAGNAPAICFAKAFILIDALYGISVLEIHRFGVPELGSAAYWISANAIN
jgi:hypothetical protein